MFCVTSGLFGLTTVVLHSKARLGGGGGGGQIIKSEEFMPN